LADAFGEDFKSKILQSVYKVKGVDYLLDDGCPLPECDETKNECFKQQIEMRKKFNGCSIGPHKDRMGCVTEYLGPSRQKFVIPKFAFYCSALCYHREEPEKLAKIHDCPFNGTRINSADERLGNPSPTTERSQGRRRRPRPTGPPRETTTTVDLIAFFSRFRPTTTERPTTRRPTQVIFRLPPAFLTTPSPAVIRPSRIPKDELESNDAGSNDLPKEDLESNEAGSNDVPTSLFDILEDQEYPDTLFSPPSV